MNRCLINNKIVLRLSFLIALLLINIHVVLGVVGTIEDAAVRASYKKGLTFYENNQPDQAVKAFKSALAATFPQQPTGKLQQAVNLAQSGKAKEAEKILLSLFDKEETAARARYELARIYESQGKIENAAILMRNALVVVAGKGAKYAGVKACQKCHIKEYKSWKKTKMAKTLDTLKPKVKAEAKKKLNFDPKKDYTKDPKCLSCHTTGYGMPGGYPVPGKSDSKAKKAAKENAGITCEGCHGPGSKYIPVHKNVATKKRKYAPEEFYRLGEYKIGAGVCTTCHNRRNPTVQPGFHFDYEKYKAEDTHEVFPLKYRKNTK